MKRMSSQRYSLNNLSDYSASLSISPVVKMTTRRKFSHQPISSHLPIIQNKFKRTCRTALSLPIMTRKRKTKKELMKILHRVLTLVRILCRVCIAIRRYAVNKTDSRVIMEVQNFLRPRESGNLLDFQSENEQGAYFNKTLYSVASNHAFPLWARTICFTQPEERKDEDLQKMCKYLRGISSFSQFDDEDQIGICRNAIYNRYDKMRIMLSQGDDPEYYYILLSGKAFVNISTKDINTGVEVTANVDTLAAPHAFGGNALMHGTKRTASVVTETWVEVLMVDQDTFQQHCCNTLKAQILRENNFIQNHDVFKTWSRRRLRLLSYDVKTKFYRSSKVIDNDLKNSPYLYFIMEGEVDVIYYDQKHDRKWLYSTVLQRNVGILGGNRIRAPSPCNLGSLLLPKKCEKHQVSCYIVSLGATVLYLSKLRFQELSPKDFLLSYQDHPPFEQLTGKDYVRESKKGIRWIEYRAKSAKESCRFINKL